MISPKRFEKLGEETQTINGRPVYTGKMHEYADDNPVEFEQMIKRMLMLSAVTAVFAAAAGCLRVPGMLNTWWVIVPYAAYLLTGVSMLWGSLRLLVNEKPLKDSVYKRTEEVLPPRSGAHVIFACILLAVYLINLFVNGSENFDTWQCVVFMICVLCSGFSAHFAYKFIKNVRWT